MRVQMMPPTAILGGSKWSGKGLGRRSDKAPISFFLFSPLHKPSVCHGQALRKRSPDST